MTDQNNNCTPNKPKPRQRNYLLSLTQKKHTTLTPNDLCCTKHASRAIDRLNKN